MTDTTKTAGGIQAAADVTKFKLEAVERVGQTFTPVPGGPPWCHTNNFDISWGLARVRRYAPQAEITMDPETTPWEENLGVVISCYENVVIALHYCEGNVRVLRRLRYEVGDTFSYIQDKGGWRGLNVDGVLEHLPRLLPHVQWELDEKVLDRNPCPVPMDVAWKLAFRHSPDARVISGANTIYTTPVENRLYGWGNKWALVIKAEREEQKFVAVSLEDEHFHLYIWEPDRTT